MMIAFITINSGLVLLIDGLCAQILYFRFQILSFRIYSFVIHAFINKYIYIYIYIYVYNIWYINWIKSCKYVYVHRLRVLAAFAEFPFSMKWQQLVAPKSIRALFLKSPTKTELVAKMTWRCRETVATLYLRCDTCMHAHMYECYRHM